MRRWVGEELHEEGKTRSRRSRNGQGECSPLANIHLLPRLISISRSPDNPLPSFALFPPDVMHLHNARGTTNGLWGLATSECDVECSEMQNYLICFVWRRKPSDAGSEENDCFSFRFYDLCNSFKHINPKVKYIILFIYFHFPFPFASPSVRVRGHTFIWYERIFTYYGDIT